MSIANSKEESSKLMLRLSWITDLLEQCERLDSTWLITLTICQRTRLSATNQTENIKHVIYCWHWPISFYFLHRDQACRDHNCLLEIFFFLLSLKEYNKLLHIHEVNFCSSGEQHNAGVSFKLAQTICLELLMTVNEWIQQICLLHPEN